MISFLKSLFDDNHKNQELLENFFDCYDKNDNLLKEVKNPSLINKIISKYNSYGQLKNFENLDLSKYPNLTKIIFKSGNNFTNNDLKILESAKKLEEIDFASCPISNFDFLTEPKLIKNIKINGNNYIDLDGFSNFYNIKTLTIKNSKLKDISFLNKFSWLSELYIENNPNIKNWHKVFQISEHLEKVIIINSELNHLKFLDKSKSLKILNVDNNKIDEIPILYFKSIETLILSNNYIEDIKNLDNIISLDTLETLNISNNKINKLIDFKKNNMIINLNLSHNNISKIENLDNFKYLEILDISYNQINKIEGLDNLKYLQTLNLNNNIIKKIENIEHLKIKYLNLSFNDIKTIEGIPEKRKSDNDVLANTSLISVDLNKNPIEYSKYSKFYKNNNDINVKISSNSLSNVYKAYLEIKKTKTELLNKKKEKEELIEFKENLDNKIEKPKEGQEDNINFGY